MADDMILPVGGILKELSKQKRVRYILIAVVLASLPCYCLGLVILRMNRNQPGQEIPTATVTATRTATITLTPYITLTPTITATVTQTTRGVDYAFSNFAAQFTWLFIGFIAGTFPSLFKKSGEKGRKTWHWLLLVLVSVGMVFFMRWMETIRSVQMAPSFVNWVLSGALIGLGVVVPGMSPSNFLIYLGLYQPMASGIRQLDLGVIVPLGLGLILIVLLLARLISWLFKKYFTVMYHLILGIVIGSTIVIIPEGVSGWTIAVCAVLFVVGALISYALAKLDEKYAREDFII